MLHTEKRMAKDLLESAVGSLDEIAPFNKVSCSGIVYFCTQLKKIGNRVWGQLEVVKDILRTPKIWWKQGQHQTWTLALNGAGVNGDPGNEVGEEAETEPSLADRYSASVSEETKSRG